MHARSSLPELPVGIHSMVPEGYFLLCEVPDGQHGKLPDGNRRPLYVSDVFFSPSDSGGTLHIDKDYLSLPQNITEVSTRDLGEYLNIFSTGR